MFPCHGGCKRHLSPAIDLSLFERSGVEVPNSRLRIYDGPHKMTVAEHNLSKVGGSKRTEGSEMGGEDEH